MRSLAFATMPNKLKIWIPFFDERVVFHMFVNVITTVGLSFYNFFNIHLNWQICLSSVWWQSPYIIYWKTTYFENSYHIASFSWDLGQILENCICSSRRSIWIYLSPDGLIRRLLEAFQNLIHWPKGRIEISFWLQVSLYTY